MNTPGMRLDPASQQRGEQLPGDGEGGGAYIQRRKTPSETWWLLSLWKGGMPSCQMPHTAANDYSPSSKPTKEEKTPPKEKTRVGQWVVEFSPPYSEGVGTPAPVKMRPVFYKSNSDDPMGSGTIIPDC